MITAIQPLAALGSFCADPVESAGYGSAAYAHSLAEFGEPIWLPNSRGWLLRRAIAQSVYSDAMGPYPLFSCENWCGLRSDLEALKGSLVSVALVPDPFGEYDEELLRSCFELVVPFKSHFVIDLCRPGPYGSSDHRYKARKALRALNVEICRDPLAMLEDWMAVYNHLICRHQIRGIKAFSARAFRKQFEVPGLVAFRAKTPDGQCAGAQVWFLQEGVAYYHLGAANELGYQLGAAYAIYATAIDYFRNKARFIELGAGAGSTSKQDGLTRFKEGWANDTRQAYFCGSILNRERYEELSSVAASPASNYFPVYRTGELS